MGVSRAAVREVLRALELLGILKAVPGGGNYITEDLDTWLIGPLSILFQLNNGYVRQNQQLRAALERENAILAAKKCTPLDAAELWMIIARLDAAEDEKMRGEDVYKRQPLCRRGSGSDGRERCRKIYAYEYFKRFPAANRRRDLLKW